jgi:hypothetical protein
MEKIEREIIGSFVITRSKHRDPNILCAMCEKLLARYNAATDDFTPSIEEIYAQGAVPIPNFGWFCGQSCADEYSGKFNVKFARNAEGKVDYYSEG